MSIYLPVVLNVKKVPGYEAFFPLCPATCFLLPEPAAVSVHTHTHTHTHTLSPFSFFSSHKQEHLLYFLPLTFCPFHSVSCYSCPSSSLQKHPCPFLQLHSIPLSGWPSVHLIIPFCCFVGYVGCFPLDLVSMLQPLGLLVKLSEVTEFILWDTL